MRQHDGPVAFRHARVSQIEIMLCGHYNRKYGAPGPVRNPPGTHLFQKRIIIYYYTGYERNNNRPRAFLPRIRSSFDRSLNTYASLDPPHPHVFLLFYLSSSPSSSPAPCSIIKISHVASRTILRNSWPALENCRGTRHAFDGHTRHLEEIVRWVSLMDDFADRIFGYCFLLFYIIACIHNIAIS